MIDHYMTIESALELLVTQTGASCPLQSGCHLIYYLHPVKFKAPGKENGGWEPPIMERSERGWDGGARRWSIYLANVSTGQGHHPPTVAKKKKRPCLSSPLQLVPRIYYRSEAKAALIIGRGGTKLPAASLVQMLPRRKLTLFLFGKRKRAGTEMVTEAAGAILRSSIGIFACGIASE